MAVRAPIAEVPQPTVPATPAVPSAPVTPAVPDPDTPAAPEEPSVIPGPEEPANPIVPNPGPGRGLCLAAPPDAPLSGGEEPATRRPPRGERVFTRLWRAFPATRAGEVGEWQETRVPAPA